MTREEAILYIKSQDMGQHFELAPTKVSGKPSYICPSCGNGSGKDGTGFYEDPNREGKYHCFKCNLDGDLVDFVAEKQKLPKGSKEVFDYLYNFYGIENENKKSASVETTQKRGTDKNPYLESCNEQLSQVMPFLATRCITEDTAVRFKLGYDNAYSFKGDLTPSLIIPKIDGSYTVRSIKSDTKDKWRANGPKTPLGIELIGKEDEIYITEGELDTMSISQLGYPSIALGGTATTKLLEALKQADRKPHLLLSLDNDEVGKEATKRLAEDLEDIGISYSITNVSGAYKDPNEALIHDVEGLKQRLSLGKRLEAMEALKDMQATNKLDSLFKAIEEGDYKPLCSTGFNELDRQLGGGLIYGLYVIGAISSLGKTTFMLQLADQIAQRGQDVIFITLEMGQHELIAKSLSRETTLGIAELNKNGSNLSLKEARSTTDILSNRPMSIEQKQAYQKAIERYRQYADNIYIYEGQGTISPKEIRRITEKHIEATGKKPVVILDYLQLIQPLNDRWEERKNIDSAVSLLRVMARDLRLPVMVVSSISRSNYASEAHLGSFKESGGIEYGADIALMLQFAEKIDSSNKNDIATHEREQKEKSQRAIELVILKNRNGITGGSIYYDYYPRYNLFTESQKEEKKGERMY